MVGEDGTCSFRAHNREQKSYTAEDIDALVAYAKPDGAWYVFPVRVIEGLRSLKLYPGSRKKRSKHEKWRRSLGDFPEGGAAGATEVVERGEVSRADQNPHPLARNASERWGT